MRILNLDDLRARGIPFSRQHIHRLVVAGRFPRPVKIGDATNGWVEAEIDSYLENCVAERDAAAAKRQTAADAGASAA